MGNFDASTGSFRAPPEPEGQKKTPESTSRSPNSAQTAASVAGLIRGSLLTNFGSVRHAAMSHLITVKYYNAGTGTGIVRVPRDSVTHAWAALTLMSTEPPAGASSLGPCLWRVRHVSGTIKGAQKAAMRLSTASIDALLPRKRSASDREPLLAMLQSCRLAISQVEA